MFVCVFTNGFMVTIETDPLLNAMVSVQPPSMTPFRYTMYILLFI